MTGAVAATPATAQAPRAAEAGRLDALDGLRGIAALLVVFYHFTSRWTVSENGESLYPHGDGLRDALPFLGLLGAYGVSLFFLISGFVMIMTLQRSSGLADFTVRRASRLWPTMIVCATLTTLLILVSQIHTRFDSIAGWEVTPMEYLSSILFIDPAFTGDMLNLGGLTWVDGVYWTLWIEVRFYALVALIYWISADASRFVWLWMGVQAYVVLHLLAYQFTSISLHWVLSLIFQPFYMSWFTLGICAFFYWENRLTRPVMVMAGLSVLGLVLTATSHTTVTADVTIMTTLLLFAAVVATFALVIFRAPVSKSLTAAWATTLGLASYPLYMFHERVGVIVMTAMNDLGIPQSLIFFSTIGLLIAVAVAMHRYIEIPAKSFMLSRAMPVAKRIETQWPGLAFRRNRNGQT